MKGEFYFLLLVYILGRYRGIDVKVSRHKLCHKRMFSIVLGYFLLWESLGIFRLDNAWYLWLYPIYSYKVLISWKISWAKISALL